MSRPRYDWWSYVKGMIRRYPELRARYQDLHTPRVTSVMSEAPVGGGDLRGMESLALRELPSTQQREYEAVAQALQATTRGFNGAARVRLIQLMFWGRRRTLASAARLIPCGEATAKRWHRDFILLVASFYGLLDEDPG